MESELTRYKRSPHPDRYSRTRMLLKSRGLIPYSKLEEEILLEQISLTMGADDEEARVFLVDYLMPNTDKGEMSKLAQMIGVAGLVGFTGQTFEKRKDHNGHLGRRSALLGIGSVLALGAVSLVPKSAYSGNHEGYEEEEEKLYVQKNPKLDPRYQKSLAAYEEDFADLPQDAKNVIISGWKTWYNSPCPDCAFR